MTVLSIDLSLILLYNMFSAKSITISRFCIIILCFYSIIFIFEIAYGGGVDINDIKLYEKIPHEQFSVRILLYKDNGYDFPLHWHEHTELHYIFKGYGRLRYGEEYFKVGEGELAVINGNELHRGMGGKRSEGAHV